MTLLTMPVYFFRTLSYVFFRIRWQRAENREGYDREIGVETGGVVDTSDFEVKEGSIPEEIMKEAVFYFPSRPGLVHHVLDHIKIDPKQFVFIDFGSGKGRVLMVVAKYAPFKEVLGVELSPVLHETAQSNMEIFRSKEPDASPISLENIDAEQLDFPEENLILYMYDPFGKNVMTRLMQNLQNSFEKFPREIYVAYASPRVKEAIEEFSFLKKQTEKQYSKDAISINWVIYKSIPFN